MNFLDGSLCSKTKHKPFNPVISADFNVGLKFPKALTKPVVGTAPFSISRRGSQKDFKQGEPSNVSLEMDQSELLNDHHHETRD